VTDGDGRWNAWLWGMLPIIALTVIAHIGTLDGDFVYDDHRFIEHNEAIRRVDVGQFFSDPATASRTEGIQPDIYRPLRTVLFSLEYALFASETETGVVDFHLRWWHLVSLLLHVANALLVFRLLRPLMRGAVVPAMLGATLFGVHPVTSESVAWLSSQGDLLAMTFMLLALVLLERPGLGRTAGGTACFALACLSKESALVLPALLVLRDLALPREDGAARPWVRVTLGRAGVLAGVAVAYLAVRMGAVGALAQVPHAHGSVLATARGMLHGLVWYAGALLWPSGFSLDARPDIPFRWTDPVVWVGAGLLLTTLAAGIHGLRTRRYLLALACLGFLVCLGPVSNVIVPLKALVADRFLYPGLAFVAVGVAAAARALRGHARAAALAVLACAVLVCAVLTTGRNRAWADEFSLWDAVRRDRPANANAYQGIAFEYARANEIGLAERAYASYLEANPIDGKSMRQLGDLFGQLAESLVPADGRYDPSTNMKHNHDMARAAQLRLYNRALRVWDQQGGLVVGRGSEAMRREMLTKWMEAAVDLEDLRAAKFANDYYIDLEADGYDHADAAAVMAKASWDRRRARVGLALQAWEAGRAQAMPEDEAQRRRLLADRAAVLADVGLDPARKSGDLVLPLEELLDGLIREAAADPRFDPNPELYLYRAMLLMAARRPEEAARALRQGLRVHPRNVALQRALQSLGQR
jgi:tetratricopeptide (TPR) repeat protein